MSNEVLDYTMINVSDVRPNINQPRSLFEDDKIEELAQSIKTHGLLQPIVVRPKDDYYELIAGERRLRAHELLELPEIMAIIKDTTDEKSAALALIENLQRENLTPIEEAEAYYKLINLEGITQEELATRMSKSQSTIANKIRLLNLSSEVKKALYEKRITERHARAMLKLNEAGQLKVLNKIEEKSLNVSQTEEVVGSITNKTDKKKSTSKSSGKDVRIALNTINQATMMIKQMGIDIKSEEKETDNEMIITLRVKK